MRSTRLKVEAGFCCDAQREHKQGWREAVAFLFGVSYGQVVLPSPVPSRIVRLLL